MFQSNPQTDGLFLMKYRTSTSAATATTALNYHLGLCTIEIYPSEAKAYEGASLIMYFKSKDSVSPSLRDLYNNTEKAKSSNFTITIHLEKDGHSHDLYVILPDNLLVGTNVFVGYTDLLDIDILIIHDISWRYFNDAIIVYCAYSDCVKSSKITIFMGDLKGDRYAIQNYEVHSIQKVFVRSWERGKYYLSEPNFGDSHVLYYFACSPVIADYSSCVSSTSRSQIITGAKLTFENGYLYLNTISLWLCGFVYGLQLVNNANEVFRAYYYIVMEDVMSIHSCHNLVLEWSFNANRIFKFDIYVLKHDESAVMVLRCGIYAGCALLSSRYQPFEMANLTSARLRPPGDVDNLHIFFVAHMTVLSSEEYYINTKVTRSVYSTYCVQKPGSTKSTSNATSDEHLSDNIDADDYIQNFPLRHRYRLQSGHGSASLTLKLNATLNNWEGLIIGAYVLSGIIILTIFFVVPVLIYLKRKKSFF